MDLTNTGELHVSFSDSLRVVTDLSLIDETVLDLQLNPDESNFFESEDALAFTWTVIEF